MTGENESRDESTVFAADPHTETLSIQAERFSALASDIAKILSDLSLEVKKSSDQLRDIERDLLEREQMLRGKELECARFVEELERFMSSIKSHARPQPME
jgi:hypothetical protein